MKRILILIICLFCSELLLSQNWFPLEIGNTWQFKVWYFGSSSTSNWWYYELETFEIEKDTVVNNKRYFKLNNSLFRFSETDQKIYVLSQDTDRVYMDFNLAIGDSGVQFNSSGSEENYLVVGDTVDAFGTTVLAKGFRIYYPSSLKEVWFAPNVGWLSDIYGSSSTFIEQNIRKTTIMSIQINSKGLTNNITNHLKSSFEIEPVTSVSSDQFQIEFIVRHPYDWLPEFIFIDSVFCESNYSNEDTVITMPKKSVYNYSPAMYRLNEVLDTSLLKSGFKFNYRFISKDKGIIPELTYSPDSGYYECIWKDPTNINETNEVIYDFYLSQNYPNPFNPTTSIQYAISHSGIVTLKVYDVLGREIATLVNKEKQPGVYEVEFDGSKLTSGTYFYRLSAGEFSETKKLILIK